MVVNMDGIYDPTNDQASVQRTLAQVAALRKQSMNLPQGQMVSGHYVKPAITQQLVPVLGGLVAELKEGQADKKQADINRMSQAALQAWMEARPTTRNEYGAGEEGPTMTPVAPTEADTTQWAASGLTNPLTKTLAADVLKDTVVNAPIRAEKAADKLANTSLVNQRYEQDRIARAELQKERLQQQWNGIQARLASSSLDRETRAELQRQSNDLRREIAQSQIESREKLAGGANEAKVAAAEIKAAGAAGGGKALSDTARKNLVQATGDVQRVVDFENTFKDEYAGAKAALNVKTGGSFIRDDPDAQAAFEWWRNFYSNENVDRNRLFGSALTAQEKTEWKKTTVTPLSSKEAIRNAIATRKRLAEVALDRYTEILQAPTAKDAVGVARRLAGVKDEEPKRALPRSNNGYDGGSKSSADESVKQTLLKEWAKPKNSQAEIDELRKELKRAGAQVLPPPPPIVPYSDAAAPAPAPASSGGWSIRRVN
jgi:hypothetical protein